MNRSLKAVARYLERRTVDGPWRITGTDRDDYYGAVVIPALAESGELFVTLERLGKNPPELLEQFLILIVVNQREDSSPELKADNRSTLDRLSQFAQESPHLNLAWVDAVSPGHELPNRDGGVGLARKIGLDLSLQRLDYAGSSPVLVCLDADTLVQSSYLTAIQTHFSVTTVGGAVMPFCHRRGRTPREQAAIDLYELYLRHHLLGLQLAGSPYAWPTIGSTLAVRAEAYVAAGGMNRRRAGEDFYFVQQLVKTCGVASVAGSRVFPSARASQRTPFGTGRSVAELAAGAASEVCFYPPRVYSVLGDWLQLATSNWQAAAGDVLRRAQALDSRLVDFFTAAGFEEVWERLQKNHPGEEGFVAAFHGWFDGLKSLRMIHALCPEREQVAAEMSVPELLRRAGVPAPVERARQLAILRGWQNRLCPFVENKVYSICRGR